MKALPEEFDESALVRSLAEGWAFEVAVAEYAPLGFGSYHWVVTDPEGTRGFATLDDLDQKPWLGDGREAAYAGLMRAFDTAFALRDGGLGFVVAPIPTSQGGETLRRIGPRHSVALFPFVDGQAGRYGHYDTAERAAVATMLAELHLHTATVQAVARRADLGLPGRRQLESGLQEVNQPWLGGPFSEPARRALGGHASDVSALLAVADRLAIDVAACSTDWVVTHGEPHAGNVIRTGKTRVLVDWDTVALAPPERDLWMIVTDTGDEADIYAEATGHQVDEVVARFFRLTWDLADLAVYISGFRAPHRRTEDTVAAFENLQHCVKIRDRWASLLE